MSEGIHDVDVSPYDEGYTVKGYFTKLCLYMLTEIQTIEGG